MSLTSMDAPLPGHLTSRPWMVGRRPPTEDYWRRFLEQSTPFGLSDGPEPGRLSTTVREQDWLDLEWHIKEALHLNKLPANWPHPALRRLFRHQGRLNRMLLIAVQKAAELAIDLLADQEQLTIVIGPRFPNRPSPARERSARGEFDRYMDAAREINRSTGGGPPIVKRFHRRQGAFNLELNRAIDTLGEMLRHLMESTGSMEATASGTASGVAPQELPPAEDWRHFIWHVREVPHLQQLAGRGGWFWLRRWRTPQEEINRLQAAALGYVLVILRQQNTTLVHLGQTVQGGGRSAKQA